MKEKAWDAISLAVGVDGKLVYNVCDKVSHRPKRCLNVLPLA